MGPVITYLARAPSDITKWQPGNASVELYRVARCMFDADSACFQRCLVQDRRSRQNRRRQVGGDRRPVRDELDLHLHHPAQAEGRPVHHPPRDVRFPIGVLLRRLTDIASHHLASPCTAPSPTRARSCTRRASRSRSPVVETRCPTLPVWCPSPAHTPPRRECFVVAATSRSQTEVVLQPRHRLRRVRRPRLRLPDPRPRCVRRFRRSSPCECVD